MSSLKKTKREITELKRAYNGISRATMATEVAPLLVELVVDTIENEGVDGVVEFLRKNKLTGDLLKENIMDLAGEKYQKEFDKIGGAAKGKLTKACNKQFKVAGEKKAKKGKPKEDKNVAAGKYDVDGNLIYENETIVDEEEEEEEEENESSEKSAKTKKTKKTKKDKTKDDKAKGGKTKGGKTKGGKKTKKSKKDEEEDEDE